jgi:SpoIID/LytB domain protein
MRTMRSTYHRVEPLLAVLAAALAALLLAAGFARGATATARVSGTSVPALEITGAGYGHGVGMSQEGALGYAEHGWSYEQILAHYYRRSAIGQAPAGSVVRVLIKGRVHRIALETYVRGVVSAEVPSSWPLAALEAQAVASRTYALTAHAGGSRFDVYADTRSQVYRGVAAHTPQTNAAVAATAGQIVTYQGRPVTTYFFASSGGMTESVQNAFLGSEPQPWLRAVADPYDGGPLHTWEMSISFATASARLAGLVRGSFRGIEVTKRGVSPRIVAASVLGSTGATAVSGTELAARLGLYDTWAYFSVRTARGITREPDVSGQPPGTSTATSAEPPAAEATATTPTGPQGGAEAPGSSDATHAGGVSAVAASYPVGAASRGTREQIAWVRRAASNFVADELSGNGAGACSILYAPLQATRHRRTCAQRWNAKLAGMLREPGGRARLRADAGAIPHAVVVVHGNWASIDLPTPLMSGASRLLWTSNCWMLDS